MATDEVSIVLRGSSKALEASLKRVEASMRRIGVTSAATNKQIATNTKKSSRAVGQQNKSLTLMVAKFALVAFAVQTLANIFNATFGAILRNIDDFQIAAIGTAAAVTSIADAGDRGIGDVFNQNLNAATAAFEKLELTAARFFSTGQELQLGFNTLAQKGVIVREEEFNTLGKLVDQIKLLTGGQNSQIQIQQELRAILDGNVRTTTAFGKSLQQRGVDITQLSREVRATGSIQVFEKFLTGLDAAGGAIRRTLTSVLATFQSLVSILGRRIFQDAFDGVVSTITTINNFLIDNLDTITSIGRGISNKIVSAFNRAIEIAKQFGSVIIDIASSDITKLIVAIKLIQFAMTAGPLGVIFALAAAFVLATGEVESFGVTIEIVMSLFRIAFDAATKQLDEFFQGIKNIATGLRLLKTGNTELISAVFDVGQAKKNLANLGKSIIRIQELIADPAASEDRIRDLNATLERRIEDQRKIQAELDRATGVLNSTPGAQEFLGQEIVNSANTASTLAEALVNLRDKLKDVEKSRGMKQFGGQIDDIVAKLKKLGVEVKSATDTDFVKTTPINPSDTRVFEAQRKEERRRQDERAEAAAKIRASNEAKDLQSIKTLATADKLTATEAFNAESELRSKSLELDKQAILERVQLIKDRLFEDQSLLREQSAATEGPTAITDATEARLKGLALEAKAQAEIDKLQVEAAKVGIDLGKLELQNKEKLLAVQREITDLIRSQQEGLNQQFGAETNEQRAARTQADSEQSTSNFRRDFPGATNQQIVDQAQNANIARIRENFNVQIAAFTGAIDQAFDALTEGLVTGSFDFKDLGQSISRDLIKAGLDGLITSIKDTVVDGLTDVFESVGQSVGQALTLALGLILAVISRSGSDGDFSATGGAGGSGIDSSSAPVRGLIGGDSSLPIAEINNGLLEALIPTNNILAAIERNTRANANLEAKLGGAALDDLIDSRVNSLFDEQLLAQ